jgi:predicted RNA polymerase sigma factor
MNRGSDGLESDRRFSVAAPDRGYGELLSLSRHSTDPLRRTTQREAAADAYGRAIELCGNSAERIYLQRRLDEMLSR